MTIAQTIVKYSDNHTQALQIAQTQAVYQVIEDGVRHMLFNADNSMLTFGDQLIAS